MARRTKSEQDAHPENETKSICLFPKCVAAGRCLGHFGLHGARKEGVRNSTQATPAHMRVFRVFQMP